MKPVRLVLSLFLAFASLFAFFVYAPNKALAIGQWTVTGSMNSVHGQDEPVVLLQNGKALIEGGSVSGGNDTNEAELYDPSTGQWTVTGSLGTARDSFSTPTVLNGGTVLVGSGSLGNPGVTTTSEIYNPSTGLWSYTGNTNVVHTHAPAVKLSDGRVLVISGIKSNTFTDSTTASEIFDPSTGQWTQTGNVNTPIFENAGNGGDAVLLNNGLVLKVGAAVQQSSAVAELYDPSTGQWTQTGSLLVSRYTAQLIKLTDGRVLMIGGIPSGAATSECEIYDPSTGQWTQTGSLNYARFGMGVVLLPDGRVLIAGGNNGLGQANSIPPQSEIYDPSTGIWTVDASVNEAHNIASMVMLSNGKVLLADGTDGTAELYTPTTNNPPVVGTVTVTPNPVQINTAVTASATFTDPDAGETYTATANWGDGINTATTCSVTAPSGSTPGSASCPLSSGYSAANVYPVTITVSDGSLTGTSPTAYASVYNPTQSSLFTAGERFSNPSTASPNTSGNVTFGLSYKYQGTMPSGVRSFSMDFNAANLHFNASTVNSLVVSGSMATLTGTGTLTGSSQIDNFFVTGVNGGGIRIQITDPSNNNNVVYDTQPGDPITATPTTSVSGQVIVH